MSANLSALLYLVAGVLFILSLRGLSSPASSRQGNFFGMIGMGIAVATTLASHPPADGLHHVGEHVITDVLRFVPNLALKHHADALLTRKGPPRYCGGLSAVV